MAYIKLKDGKQIRLSPERAKSVDKAFKDQNVPVTQTISIDGQSFVKSLIAYISTHDEEDTAELKKDELQEHARKLKKQQLDEFEMLLSLTPEQRSVNTKFFELFYFTIKDCKPSNEEKVIAQELQLAYFKENNVPFPSPVIFKSMMDGVDSKDLFGYQVTMFGIVKNLFLMASTYIPRKSYAITKQIESYQ